MSNLTPVADVLSLLDRRIQPLECESVVSVHAAGRVLAEPVVSKVNVPAFARSAMDGYALRAVDSQLGSRLSVVGQSLPGRPFEGVVDANEAVRITTGAPLPSGADAVVMVERTELRDGSVLIREAVESGRHVIRIGEDVAEGRTVLPAGRILRPQDIGLLAAIGEREVPVIRRPRVAILATGGELLPPGSIPTDSCIVDSNSPMLAALISRDAGEVLPVRYVPDDLEAIRNALAEAAPTADLILLNGGTSVGSEDHAAKAVASLGELAVHGVNLRPGRPMGVGFLPKPVFLLPGNPAACLCVYELFAGRVVRRLGRRAWEIPYACVLYRLGEELASAKDRVDFVRVKRGDGVLQILAGGGASGLSNAVEADGFVIVPADRERLEAGELVEVYFYDLE